MMNKLFGRKERQKGKIQGYCICKKCGYSTRHTPGNPCRNITCPVCHIPLTRDNNYSQVNKSFNSNLKTKTMNIPKVNIDICTGCGACIDVCPMEAIVIKDGKAFILEDKCANCRICERECPVEAIS